MKIVIIGMGGSGKSTLQKKFNKKGIPSILQYTDREKRDNTEDCYHFLSIEEMDKKISDFVEYKEFFIKTSKTPQRVRYGTLLEDFNKESFVFVTSPKSFKELYKKDIIKKDFFVILLKPKDSIIKQRLEQRYGKDNEEVNRRFISDKEDFRGFPHHRIDLRITNGNF